MIGTAERYWSDRMFLERLPVNSADDGTLFQAKVQGGYDWLHSLTILPSKWIAGRGVPC